MYVASIFSFDDDRQSIFVGVFPNSCRSQKFQNIASVFPLLFEKWKSLNDFEICGCVTLTRLHH